MARNLNEYMNRIGDALQTALNSEAGQELVGALLEMETRKNPNMTAEQWNEAKAQFMVYMFAQAVKENEELRKELGRHVWEEMREEARA